MSESTLLIAFVAFIFFVLIIAVIVRKISVRDIFENTSSPVTMRPPSFEKAFPAPIKQSDSPRSSLDKKNFNLDREKTHKVAKALSTIGIIILFIPLPDAYKIVGLGMAFLGSMLAKATAPKKKKTSREKNPTAQKIRQLASKPEYQAALKLLYDDYSKSPPATEGEQYRRAVKYLQSKGVPPAEAKENLMLLLTLLTKQKNTATRR